MEFEPNQLQLFVSLTVILIAAFVALICDYLKYDNEKLRELVLELKVRGDEQQKYTVRAAAKIAEPASVESRQKAAARQAIAPPVTKAAANVPPQFAPKALVQVAQSDAQSQVTRAETPAADDPVRIIVPQETLSLGAAPERIGRTERVREPVLENARDTQTPLEADAALYASGHVIDMRSDMRSGAPRKHEPINMHSDKNADMIPSGDPSESLSETLSPDSVPAQSTPVVVTLSETVQKDAGKAPREFSATSSPETSTSNFKKDWNSILSRRRASQQAEHAAPFARPVEVREDLLEAVVAASTAMRSEANLGEVPAGFHDGYVLSRLLKSRRPLSGLVVSIGMNAGTANGAFSPDTVRGLVESLMGPRDFACQVGADEFLLIYPSETGASAQRRLGYISQRLWDFQLGSLGEASVMLSWGGVEVRSESLDEACASASERMRETKRSRQDFALYRTMRKAV